MKKSQPALFAGLVAPALLALHACTGPTTDPASTEDTPVAGKTAEAPDSPRSQDPQGRQEERQAALLADTIRKARRALEVGKWDLAFREAGIALQIDNNNAEARDLFNRAAERLGQRQATKVAGENSGILRWQVHQERDRARAIEHANQGEAHAQAGRLDSAVESLERAVTVLQFSPFFSPGDPLVNQLRARLDAAKTSREEARRRKIADDIAATEEAQRKEARLRMIAQMTRVKRLFEEANRSFQRGHYDACLRSLEMVLRERQFDKNALALKDLASRARHDQAMEQLNRRWKNAWVETFQLLSHSDVPQHDVYEFDRDVRREINKRKPMTFKSTGDFESPEEQAILARLNSNPQPFNISAATLAEWATYFGDRTEVNFVVTKSAAELDSEKTTLTNFTLPPKTPAQALDIIGAQTGVKWRIQHSAVHLVSAEDKAAVGRMYLHPYDVRDIVNGVPDKPGVEPKLTVPGEEDMMGMGDDAEAKPTIVDAGRLMELIQGNIGTDTWDGGAASISELRGTIFVRHTREIHRKIEKLLADLRQSVGIQVDVESRFLKVTDNFLEDVGVDFRGLGNNSSEGQPGRGLDARPNVGFDDFGRRENINPASPGLLGTGTEPGIFYDDGGDGDIFGRVENLFDSAIAGEDGLRNEGGLSLQYAFLDDTEVEAIFRAVAKNDRSQEITAPRLLVYNNTRANMSVLRETTYIKDFEVEIAQAAAVANPVVGVVKDGVSLDVRPVVSADRRFITMELRPTVLDLTLPIPTFTTTLGVGQPITLQLPETQLKKVRTTVTMPDGGTVVLGGMKISNKIRLESGVPVFSQIPIVSFFFGRKANSITNSNLLILIRASIVIPSEHEPDFPPSYLEQLIGGGK